MDLICGEWGASKCSAKRWFDFLGDSTSPYVPFQINYLPQPDTTPVDNYIPNDPKTIPCNQAIDVSQIANCLVSMLLIFYGMQFKHTQFVFEFC